MSVLEDVAQKVKGEAQKVKAAVEKNTGKPVEGFVDDLKGHFNSNSADAKMETKDEV